MRTLSDDLAAHAGQTVSLSGWLHKKRILGGLNFVVIRDRRGLAQAVISRDEELEKLRNLQVGTVLKLTGQVASDQRAPGGAELRDASVEVLVPVTEVPAIEIDKPINHSPDNLDTLFENRVLNLRNPGEQAIFRLRAQVNRLIRQYLMDNEFVEIQTPKLLAGAAEGGAEVFKTDYFGQEATLAQSPQLYKQIMVGAFERVFEIGPAFRAEPSMTTRHMSESTMLDVELGFIKSHEDVLAVAEDMVYQVLTRLYGDQAALLKSLQALPLTLTKKFPRYKVAEVHRLYSQAIGQDTTKEKDLLPAEERWICDHAKQADGSEAVFVTDFPIESHKFYQMINPKDPGTVLWADLLFRGVEIASCPQREHRLEQLLKQMRDKGIDPQHPGFKYYLQAFAAGLPPHGGFGFGIDRFVQKIIGLGNVKEATLFPRDVHRLAP